MTAGIATLKFICCSAWNFIIIKSLLDLSKDFLLGCCVITQNEARYDFKRLGFFAIK